MCVRCYKNTKKRNAKKVKATKALKASLPDGMKMCMACQTPYPTEDFTPNPGRRRSLAEGRLSSTCSKCRARRAKERREGRHEMSPDKRAEYLAGRRDYMRQFRAKILAAYGGFCKCCGESIPEFLELHHKNNDGHAHRKEIGANSESLYRWLVKNNFPDTMELICANCHAAE